jgi:uncharacterized protein YmfQ (DUF2313 family)
MALTADDYKEILKANTPQGRAWPTDEEDSTLNQLYDALAQEFARVDGRVDELFQEMNPKETLELLADWERVMGLPDNCGTPPETVQARRNAIITKLNAIGSGKPQYFIDLAAAFGFPITITEFRAFRAGIGEAGTPIYSEEWAYYWQVNAALLNIFYFRAGLSTAGEALRTWGNETLECLINRYKPAHTDVIFSYT